MWKGIAFRGPVVLVVAAIVVAVVVVVAVVGCNSQLKVGGNNLPPKAAGGNNLPPQFWRQQSATKINNLPPKRWRQQSATKKLAATICHQKVGGNNLPPESLRQQSTSWQQQVWHHVLSSVAYVLCTPPSLHSIAHSLQASRHCSTSTEIQRRAF